jgi:hypothetical protein
MAADDFLNTPPDQGFPTDLDAGSSMSGNRPASGAKRATPGEVLSQGFQGDQNAGDFLGLDTEFTASQDPNQGYGGSPLDLVPPPGTYDDQGYAAVPAPAPQPVSDPVQDFAQAPSAFEFGDDLGSEEGELPLEDLGGPTTSRKPLLVGTLLVAALAAGAVVYGPSLYSRYFGSEPKVADDAGKGWEQKPTKPKPAPGEASKPAIDPTSVVAVDPTVSTPDAPVTTPKPPVTNPLVSSKPSPEPARPITTDPSTGSRPTVATQTPSTDATAPSVTPRPQPVAFPNLAGPEYSWAAEDSLELIWRGSEVPLESLKSPAKTIMPRVGNVRVFTTGGDVLEGRLFAVGQNRVWIDAQPGRIGIDGDKVERIEVLPPVPEGQAKSSEELQLAGSKRVRVRVPGGMLYGRVLKAEGDEVTLALDDGGRVRVKAGDVQELGTGRAVVVRR